jgi:hypothetical protein
MKKMPTPLPLVHRPEGAIFYWSMEGEGVQQLATCIVQRLVNFFVAVLQEGQVVDGGAKPHHNRSRRERQRLLPYNQAPTISIAANGH